MSIYFKPTLLFVNGREDPQQSGASHFTQVFVSAFIALSDGTIHFALHCLTGLNENGERWSVMVRMPGWRVLDDAKL